MGYWLKPDWLRPPPMPVVWPSVEKPVFWLKPPPSPWLGAAEYGVLFVAREPLFYWLKKPPVPPELPIACKP